MRQSIDLLHYWLSQERNARPRLVASIYIFNPSFAADLFFASPFVHLVYIHGEQKYRQ